MSLFSSFGEAAGFSRHLGLCPPADGFPLLLRAERGSIFLSAKTPSFTQSRGVATLFGSGARSSFRPNQSLDVIKMEILAGFVRVFLYFAVGLLALLVPVGTVSAADMPVEPQVVLRGTYVPDPVYNWTGVYIGANAGYGWGNADWGNLGGIYSAKGGMFGGQIGYNWQLGQFVYSLEGGVDLTDLQDTINVLGCTARVCSAKNMLLSTMPTVRTRVGMTFGRWMPYLAVGMAVGDIRTNTFGNIRRNTFGLEEINQTSAGWTVGAGVEVALINNWSARLEYVYADFGSTKCVLYCGLAGTTFDFTMSALRGGVNYRF